MGSSGNAEYMGSVRVIKIGYNHRKITIFFFANKIWNLLLRNEKLI